jgi:hypothetical protein
MADPILAYWQLKPVRHPIAGLPLWVPFGVGSIKFERSPALILKPQTKIAAISFNFFPNGNLRATLIEGAKRALELRRTSESKTARTSGRTANEGINPKTAPAYTLRHPAKAGAQPAQ